MSDDEVELAGIWRPQRVVKAETDARTPFVVTRTFKDGYCARVDLRDESADNLGVVLRDPEALRELRVDELGIIAVVGIYIAGSS